MRIIKPVEFDPSEGNFSRASTGTYFDKDGVLRTAAVDEPRWNYTFEDGEWVGPELLVEGQATNLLTYSERLWDTAAWGVGSALINFFTVTSSTDIADIYGAPASIAKFVAGTTPSPLFLRKNGLSLAGGSTYSPSLFVYVPAQAGVTSWGIYADYQDLDTSLPFVSAAFGRWIKVAIPAKTLTGARNFIDLNLRVNGGNPSSGFTFYATGAQLEVGDHPTSYIRTLGAPVTRAADIPGRIVSNVPEDDAPVWVAGTYGQGDRVIQNHHVYEVLAETTTDSPTAGVAKSPPTWLNLGATNRWRMFDDKVGSLTEKTGSIAVELQPGTVINSVALFNLLGRSATVTLTDPVDGIVYQRTVSLVDAGVTNWYEWFFAPIGRQTDFVLLDLPAYGTATLSVVIDNAAGTAACGHLVMGRQAEIGVALYGSGVGITDYSRKEADAFGNAIVVERSFSKRAEFDVMVDTPQIGRVQRLLAGIRAQPVVWIGAESYESTVLFGYYRDFSISISGPSVSDATITVEGLT